MRNEEYQGFEPVDYDMDELLELDKQDPSTLSASQRLNLANGKASFMRRYNRIRSNQEASSLHVSPSYDRKKAELRIARFEVKLSLGTNSEIICRKLFRGGRPVKHPVEIGELKPALGLNGPDTRGDDKSFYRKVDYLNLTISRQTGINKFFVVSNRKIWFNPDHQDSYL